MDGDACGGASIGKNINTSPTAQCVGACPAIKGIVALSAGNAIGTAVADQKVMSVAASQVLKTRDGVSFSVAAGSCVEVKAHDDAFYIVGIIKPIPVSAPIQEIRARTAAENVVSVSSAKNVGTVLSAQSVFTASAV